MNDDYKINISVSGSILDNSIDLFLDGVHSVKHKRPSESFFSPDPDLKSALLAITTGVELLLKAKITSIDWKQLFKDPTKANKNKLTDGTLMSINLEKCLKRIEDISTIRFTDKTKEDIDTIRITRNKITHYHHNPQDNEIISLIADAIGVYIEFYKEHIFETFCEEKNRVRYTDRDLKEVKEYVKVRVKRIKEEIKGIAKPITYHFCECPGCLQDVHVLKDKKTVLCSFLCTS